MTKRRMDAGPGCPGCATPLRATRFDGSFPQADGSELLALGVAGFWCAGCAAFSLDRDVAVHLGIADLAPSMLIESDAVLVAG